MSLPTVSFENATDAWLTLSSNMNLNSGWSSVTTAIIPPKKTFQWRFLDSSFDPGLSMNLLPLLPFINDSYQLAMKADSYVWTIAAIEQKGNNVAFCIDNNNNNDNDNHDDNHENDDNNDNNETQKRLLDTLSLNLLPDLSQEAKVTIVRKNVSTLLETCESFLLPHHSSCFSSCLPFNLSSKLMRLHETTRLMMEAQTINENNENAIVNANIKAKRDEMEQFQEEILEE